MNKANIESIEQGKDFGHITSQACVGVKKTNALKRDFA